MHAKLKVMQMCSGRLWSFFWDSADVINGSWHLLLSLERTWNHHNAQANTCKEGKLAFKRKPTLSFLSGSHGKISRRKTRIYIVSHPSSTLMPEISNSEKCIQTMCSLPRLSLTCILYIGWATWRQDKTSNPRRCGPLHFFFYYHKVGEEANDYCLY